MAQNNVGETTRPQFALDHVDLGPSIRLTRFTPDYDIYPVQNAVEGANGRLYVAYLPGRPPSQWGLIGGEASRVGTLDNGKMHSIHVSDNKTFNSDPPMQGLLWMEGLLNGMPVVRVREGNTWRHVLITNDGVRRLMTVPPGLQQWRP